MIRGCDLWFSKSVVRLQAQCQKIRLGLKWDCKLIYMYIIRPTWCIQTTCVHIYVGTKQRPYTQDKTPV